MFRLTYIFLVFSCLLAKENQIFWDGRDWNKINKNADFNENHEYKISTPVRHLILLRTEAPSHGAHPV